MFEKVKKEDIIKGIKDYEENGLPNGFGPSSTYDLVYDGNIYPPKAIMAYANFNSTGEMLLNNFKGGEGTECFKAYQRLGFEIKPKLNTMEVIDVKEEFANWLLKNAPNSYKSYLGTSTGDILIRLNELDNFKCHEAISHSDYGLRISI